jgi:hypothetical protein
MTELDEFREGKNEYFASAPESPLTLRQRKAFEGLIYYSEDPGLAFDLELERTGEREEVRMPTTTGGEQIYNRAGVVRFEVDGRRAELTLYEPQDGGDLFLPFRDATSANETYGGGRYLEVAAPHNGRVHVDFNYAYNPYCAYDDAWSCPIPPTENWLTVPIRAGEKAFPTGQDAEVA